jgi:putative cell wall-binding protein
VTQKLSIIKSFPRGIPIAVAFVSAAFLGCGQSDQEARESTGNSSPSAIARVSGGDPAVLAANVALTVYPSTTPAQRPKSVSLVPEDSWQDAVAAAVFMAHPLRAPLLISSAAGMPEPTTSAVNLLQPHGNRLKPSGNASRNGAPFFAIGTVATPAQGRTYRTGETDGAAQAASIEEFRKVLFREAPKRVLVVSEDDSAFALPAAAWTAHSGDPVLYTATDQLPQATIAALKRYPAKAYVLGPPAVISQSVVVELRKLTRGVKRISGATPAENAVALARYADANFGWGIDGPGHDLVIARSDEPLEAALASPLSASGDPGPLLLTEGADTLPTALRRYLAAVRPANHVWLVGDREAIAPSQEAEIAQLTEAGKR